MSIDLLCKDLRESAMEKCAKIADQYARDCLMVNAQEKAAAARDIAELIRKAI